MEDGNNQINKDWFMRHRMFFAVVTGIIVLAGLIVQWKISYWRANFTVDLPIHKEKAIDSTQADIPDQTAP